MNSKIKKILREGLLRESLSDITYHFTTTNKTIEILKTNQFNLTPVFGTEADAEINNNKLFMLSTTSSRHTKIGYAASLAKQQLVRLTLDGNKLNHNYQSKRVDYWRRPKDPKDKVYSTTHKDDLLNTISRQDELEDRIISDNNTINSANNYISVVEVLNGKPNQLWEIKQLCDEMGLTIYAYGDEKSFNGSLKGNALKIVEPDNSEENDEYETNYMDRYDLMLSTLLFKDGKLKGQIYPKLKKLGLNIDDIDAMVNKVNEDRLVRAFNYGYDSYYTVDFMNSLMADIHNAKTSTNEVIRFIIRELGLDMKRHKCTTMKQYFMYKIFMGKKTDEDFKNELLEITTSHLKQYYGEQLKDIEGVDYEYNGEWYNGLAQFEPVKNLLQTNFNIIQKNLLEGIKATNKISLHPLLTDFSRQNLEKLTNCYLESQQFKELESMIGEDKSDNVFYVLHNTIGEITRFVSDKTFELVDESKEQWVVNQ